MRAKTKLLLLASLPLMAAACHQTATVDNVSAMNDTDMNAAMMDDAGNGAMMNDVDINATTANVADTRTTGDNR